MTYFNYHAKAKNLIKSDQCFAVTIFENYHNIKPAMVLYFNCSKPIPIRNYRWHEYFPLIKEKNLTISNPKKIPLNELTSHD